MTELLIVIIVVLVLAVILLSGRSRQIDSAKSERSDTLEKRQSWDHESIMSPEQVEEKLQGLFKLIEEEIVPTHPHRAELLKEIVQEWGDLKKEAFNDRRSWVRKPEDGKEE